MSANTQVEYVPTSFETISSKNTLNSFFDKALDELTNEARIRYDIFLEERKKPLTQSERYYKKVRPNPVSFETYLQKCIEATRGRMYNCNFDTLTRLHTYNNSHFGMRPPSPDGRYHNDEYPSGKHICQHPSFGYNWEYGSHYIGKYSMNEVEKYHLQEVANTRNNFS